VATAQESSNKRGFLLVEFRHGDGASVRELYTNYQQDVSGHTSTPNMEVSLPPNDGVLGNRELRVVLPSDSFVDRLSNGLRHSPVFVRVRELTEGVDLSDVSIEMTLFRGRVMRSVRNFQGVSGRVALFSQTRKAENRLDIRMGLACNHHCVATLFGPLCQLDIDNFAVMGHIDSVDGKEIIVTASAVQTVSREWRRGWLEKEGLRIPISDWDSADPTKFFTARRVPDDWIGGTNDVRFVPGCNKTIEQCRSDYNNEQHFSGLGYDIPAHQPNLEGK